MIYDELKASLSQDVPPPGATPPLQALWHDAKGNGSKAHETAQSIHDETGAWIRAYLHRKEGDLSNPSYWYSRAGKPKSNASLQSEWEEIVRALTGT